MPNGTPALYGRWRSGDPTLDPNIAPTPTQTPGSRGFTTNPDGTFSPDNTGVFAVHMALMHTPFKNMAIGAVYRDGDAGSETGIVLNFDLSKFLEQYKNVDLNEFLTP